MAHFFPLKLHWTGVRSTPSKACEEAFGLLRKTVHLRLWADVLSDAQTRDCEKTSLISGQTPEIEAMPDKCVQTIGKAIGQVASLAANNSSSIEARTVPKGTFTKATAAEAVVSSAVQLLATLRPTISQGPMPQEPRKMAQTSATRCRL
eukprot:s3222_g12.t1